MDEAVAALAVVQPGEGLGDPNQEENVVLVEGHLINLVGDSIVVLPRTTNQTKIVRPNVADVVDVVAAAAVVAVSMAVY